MAVVGDVARYEEACRIPEIGIHIVIRKDVVERALSRPDDDVTDEENNVIVNTMTLEGEFIPGFYVRREKHPGGESGTDPSHWALDASKQHLGQSINQ